MCSPCPRAPQQPRGGGLTLEVLPADEAGIDVDVGQGDGAELLEVEVQDTPGGRVVSQGCGGAGQIPRDRGTPNTPVTHLLMVSR